MGNASADNLIGRILSEAQESADRIIADADTLCGSIRQDRDARISEKAAALKKTRDIQVREILDGASTRARLDGRKALLAEKRVILDETFAAAYKAVCELPESELARLFADVLKAEAQTGDTVVCANADRGAVQNAINTAGVSVRLADSAASVDRGFVLYGKSYEKDCSLKAILSELRDREETKVAEILFS